MLVFGPMKRFSKAGSQKKQLSIGLERLGIQGWWNKKTKSFLRNGTENSVCSLCIAQAKTINFDEPFSVLIPNANIIKDEIPTRRRSDYNFFSTHRAWKA
jgi:hypothetical protein